MPAQEVHHPVIRAMRFTSFSASDGPVVTPYADSVTALTACLRRRVGARLAVREGVDSGSRKPFNERFKT